MIYKPKSQLEKFGEKIYFLLVDNFPQTFYVGGMVRDLLLHKKVTDVDIATEGRPQSVIELLSADGISTDLRFKNFGVISAKRGSHKIEITTFRKDLPSHSRYPKIEFTTSVKIDSQRRDFTINALYLSQKTDEILDFHNGLKDIKAKRLKFIDNPEKRIKEDPLRIIRALRFSFDLNLNIEAQSKKVINKNFSLVKTLTKSRLENELEKIKSARNKKAIQKIISAGKFT